MGWEQEELKRLKVAEAEAEASRRKSLIPTNSETEQRFREYVCRLEKRLANIDPNLRETARYFYLVGRCVSRDAGRPSWTPSSAVCAERLLIYSSHDRLRLEKGVGAEGMLWMTSGDVMLLGILGVEGTGDAAEYVIRWYNVTGDQGIDALVQYLVTGSTVGLRRLKWKRIGCLEVSCLSLLFAVIALILGVYLR